MPSNPSAKETIYLSTTLDGHAALERLLESGKHVDRIITAPAAKRRTVSDFADFGPLAKRYGVPLVRTNDANAVIQRGNWKADLLIVNGWSQLIRSAVLTRFSKGCVGTHPSLLPRNRGRAPIPWHFINREKFGGVTVFYLAEGCDNGPIIDQRRFRLTDSDNARTYYERIAEYGGALLCKHFDRIKAGRSRKSAMVQDERQATYLLRRTPDDSRLDVRLGAAEIVDRVRAVSDIYPLVFFFWKGRRFRVREAAVDMGARISGSVGQIARVSDSELSIVTGEGIVRFWSIIDRYYRSVDIGKTFKVGERLG